MSHKIFRNLAVLKPKFAVEIFVMKTAVMLVLLKMFYSYTRQNIDPNISFTSVASPKIYAKQLNEEDVLLRFQETATTFTRDHGFHLNLIKRFVSAT